MCSKYWGILLGLLTLFSNHAAAAEYLRYHFQPGKDVVYEVTFASKITEIEMTNTETSYLLLRPLEINQAGDRIEMTYVWCLRDTKETEGDKSHQQESTDIQKLRRSSLEKLPRKRLFVVSDSGNVTEADPKDSGGILHHGLGYAIHLPFLRVPDVKQNTWLWQMGYKVLCEVREDPKRKDSKWVPGVKMMDIKNQCTPGEENADTLTVNLHQTAASREKDGDQPLETRIGDGKYVFDKKLGLIREYQLQIIRELQGATPIKYALNVSMRLLDDKEFASIQDKLASEEGKMIANNPTVPPAAAGGVVKPATPVDPLALPEGMKKSDMLGSTTGGGPYLRVDDQKRPVLGFRIELSEWAGKKCFRTLIPIYESVDAKKENETIVMAKEGYAVGAVNVYAKDFVNAVMITFMKKTDNGLDPKTSYNSPLFGVPAIKTAKRLGGTGQLIYGSFGRQGLNVDAFGLVLEEKPPIASPTTKPIGVPIGK